MALQFILGSSRSGKTNFIYEQMIKDSMEHEDEEFFFIVPDQSTLNAQRQLVERHPRHGTFNIDVVGFFRLTYRVFEELSYIPKDLLEDEGKSMVIRKIMEQHKDELKVFGSSMKKQGFIDELKSFFAEVYQYDVSMDDLRKITDAMKEEGLRSKMDDILLVMDQFEDYIKERYLISEQLLDVLAQKIDQSKKLKDATFYLDGFTGFTPIQRKVLEKLLKIGKNVYVGLTLDGRYVRSQYREYELFAMSKKEKYELIKLAQEAGTPVMPDIICWPDERDSKELRHLEQNIERYPYETYQEAPQDIKIRCFMNPRQESRAVANEIERFVREEGYRYKDIVVLTADLDSYQNELEKSFDDLHIPYFVDVNRKLLNNPCIETLLSVLKMIQKDFSYDMVFRYLKSGFSNFTMEEADFLENYVLACGVRGFARWNRPFTSKLFSDEEIQRAEELRIRFIEEVKELKTKYPQGGERCLIYATTGRSINSSMLPADAGCIVHNVDTIYSIYMAVIEGKPLTKRIVTVTGDGVKEPGNFYVWLGTNYRQLLEAAGGPVGEPEKYISGGPMMGFAMYSLDVPVVKGSSSLLVFKEDVVSKLETSACIRCGRCGDGCPSHLLPAKLAGFASRNDEAGFLKFDGMECVECGSCSYVCPAKRPLTQQIKSMRRTIMANRRKK